MERLDGQAGGAMPLDHPLVAAVLRARRSVGLPTAPGTVRPTPTRRWPAGIPAVALGCCQGEDMHAPTERIRADTIGTGAEQLCAVLAEVPLRLWNPRTWNPRRLEP